MGDDVPANFEDEMPELGGSNAAERMHELFQEMSKLEDSVRVHRALLEAEEQLLYVDVIAHLERVHQKLVHQRAEQRFTLTPWVRTQSTMQTWPGCVC